MEGLSSLFSAVKHRVRDYYLTVEYMTPILYFVAGKLTLPYYCPTEYSEEPKSDILFLNNPKPPFYIINR